MRDIVSDTD